MVDTVPSLVISLRYGGDGDGGQDIEDGTSAKHTEERHASNHSVWALSLDSESCHDNSPIWDVKKKGEGRAPKKGKEGKNESDNVQSKGNHGDVEITEEVTSEKLINAHVSTSRLPLVLSEKVQRSKVDETDKITKATAHQTDQNMDVEEPSNGKIKRKAEKSSGVARKIGKTAG
ncbi:hypothetical protein NC652_034210 [Populus alba x Populus x berolinensis]|nr:hypothetical protein NC652_034210 [Populus alba x Populus x berolinensis]